MVIETKEDKRQKWKLPIWY